MPVKFRAGGVVSIDAAINEDSGRLTGIWPAYADVLLPGVVVLWAAMPRLLWDRCRDKGFGRLLLGEKNLRKLTKFFIVVFGLSARELLPIDGLGRRLSA